MKKNFLLFFSILFVFTSNLFGWSPSMLSDTPGWYYMSEEEMAKYRLPTGEVLNMVGVRQDIAFPEDCRVNSEPTIEEVGDDDGFIGREVGFPRLTLEPEDILKKYNAWRDYHNKNCRTCFGRWAFIFEDNNAMKEFLHELHIISKKLKTTILHLLVELKFLAYLDQFVECLDKHKDEFEGYNINAVPGRECLCKKHNYGPAVFYAALLNDEKRVEQLINAGANIYIKNPYGYNILHAAVYYKNFKMVKFILNKYDCDRNEDIKIPDILNDQKNNTEQAPLHFAVWMLNLNVLDLLLIRDDINPNPIDGAGQEVFHIISNMCTHKWTCGVPFRGNVIDMIEKLLKKIEHYIAKYDCAGNYPWDYLKDRDDLKYIAEKIENGRITNYFWLMYYKARGY